MGKLTEQYHNQYQRIIEKELLRNPDNCYVIKEELWTFYQWLADIDADPCESEKIMMAISELASQKEFDLIDKIGKGFRAFNTIEDNFN